MGAADFKKPSEGAPGRFELKPELRQEYNPFSYHYLRSEISETVHYLHKQCKVGFVKNS